jgi:hypothetical protein
MATLADLGGTDDRASDPREVLTRSRVDLITMIEHGIPAREYVPGARGLLPRAKRAHISAEKKTGKSLVFGVVVALQVVAAEGIVVVLDRENGAEEYARRMEEVLDARDADDGFRQLVRLQHRYHAWPELRLQWRDDPNYAEAFGEADVVVFDSSRSHTAPLGLKENESDDYAKFATALIDPLMRANKTVIVLDNVGHEEKDRARGTTAKEDICDLAFTMKTIAPFSSRVAGRVELRCIASRIGEITAADRWQMRLGDGHYGAWERIGGPTPPAARADHREATVAVLRDAAGVLSRRKIEEALRDKGLRFSTTAFRDALAAWSADDTSGIIADPDGKGYKWFGGAPNHRRVEDALNHDEPLTAAAGQTPATTRYQSGSAVREPPREASGSRVAPPKGATRHEPPDQPNANGSLPDGWTWQRLDDIEAARQAEEAECG